MPAALHKISEVQMLNGGRLFLQLVSHGVTTVAMAKLSCHQLGFQGGLPVVVAEASRPMRGAGARSAVPTTAVHSSARRFELAATGPCQQTLPHEQHFSSSAGA